MSKLTADEYRVISQIANRAWKHESVRASYASISDLEMDLEATHNCGNPLDVQKLLDAPDGTFFHDLSGIEEHLDRKTGELKDFFVPRCTKQKEKA